MKDYFSDQSKSYAIYRPCYPDDLFQYLSSQISSHNTALDCATGNGQSAIGLNSFFREVIAIDISQQQLADAFQQTGIEYRLAAAEHTKIKDSSIDLITVAQAVHWFDLGLFYKEAKRILMPHGALAVWCYNINFQINARVDPLIRKIYYTDLFPLEPEEIHLYVDKSYQTLPFPLQEIEAPDFFAQGHYNFFDLLNYVKTWTCTKFFLQRNSEADFEKLFSAVKKSWPQDPSKKLQIIWPLSLKVGRFEV